MRKAVPRSGFRVPNLYHASVDLLQSGFGTRNLELGIYLCLLFALLLHTSACSRKPDSNTLVMIIESSPANLDPRVGTDAQSERIDKLLFDALVRRDEHFNLQPWLAERWEIPDPLTYLFHLRHDVRFHDGRPLTARDVKWTLDTVRSGKLRTAKTSTYAQIDRVDTPDDYTVVVHLKEPFATLLWNLSDGAFGVVPAGSDDTIARNPIGSGPFRLVSMEQDKEVVLARNDNYWGEHAHVPRLRFAVVPDTTTRALELRKGSADAAINAFTGDLYLALEKQHNIRLVKAPGSIYAYLAMNLRDPILKDVQVRRALSCALNRQEIIHYLLRDFAEPAASVLPPTHWAFDSDVPQYAYDPARARQILDSAGYKPDASGVRFHLMMKTSTEESTRLFAAVLQQQLRAVGIVLDIRSFEFATFYSDVQKGAFQLYSLRWIGGNEDPDIFEALFHSASVPPKRFNRGFYSNPKIDALIEAGRRELDQNKRRAIYADVQRMLAEDLPYINLWYYDNVLVTSARVRNVELSHSGNYDFLVKAEIAR